MSFSSYYKEYPYQIIYSFEEFNDSNNVEHNIILAKTFDDAYEYVVNEYCEDDYIQLIPYETLKKQNGGLVWVANDNEIIKRCYIKLHAFSPRCCSLKDKILNYIKNENNNENWYVSMYYTIVYEISEHIIEISQLQNTIFKLYENTLTISPISSPVNKISSMTSSFVHSKNNNKYKQTNLTKCNFSTEKLEKFYLAHQHESQCDCVDFINPTDKLFSFIETITGMLKKPKNVLNLLKKHENFVVSKNDIDDNFLNILDTYVYVFFCNNGNITNSLIEETQKN